MLITVTPYIKLKFFLKHLYRHCIVLKANGRSTISDMCDERNNPAQIHQRDKTSVGDIPLHQNSM
jgi:hypothetical protein